MARYSSAVNGLRSRASGSLGSVGRKIDPLNMMGMYTTEFTSAASARRNRIIGTGATSALVAGSIAGEHIKRNRRNGSSTMPQLGPNVNMNGYYAAT